MRACQNRSAPRYSLAINVSPSTTPAPLSILVTLRSLHHSGKHPSIHCAVSQGDTTLRFCSSNTHVSACSAIRLPVNEYPLFDALGDELVASGKLSKLQLEGVRYACQKHLEVRVVAPHTSCSAIIVSQRYLIASLAMCRCSHLEFAPGSSSGMAREWARVDRSAASCATTTAGDAPSTCGSAPPRTCTLTQSETSGI